MRRPKAPSHSNMNNKLSLSIYVLIIFNFYSNYLRLYTNSVEWTFENYSIEICGKLLKITLTWVVIFENGKLVVRHFISYSFHKTSSSLSVRWSNNTDSEFNHMSQNKPNTRPKTQREPENSPTLFIPKCSYRKRNHWIFFFSQKKAITFHFSVEKYHLTPDYTHCLVSGFQPQKCLIDSKAKIHLNVATISFAIRQMAVPLRAENG